ncbi:MAG: hypothetical protein ACOX6Q_00400 [Candidatus Dojkabacteria bacterium]|jgi:hypothetical protein
MKQTFKTVIKTTKLLLLLTSVLLLPLSQIYADGESTEKPITTLENTTTNTEPTSTEKKVEKIDENQTKVTTKYFDLLLIRKNQSALFGYVPYELQITPHLDSSKTQILWYTPTTLSASPRHKEFISMREGITYKVKANIKPLKSGTYEITASVISWQHDTNYANTINDTLTFDKSLVLQPSSTQYVVMSILKYIMFVAIFAAICFAIVKLSKRYVTKAKQWLTPPY